MSLNIAPTGIQRFHHWCELVVSASYELRKVKSLIIKIRWDFIPWRNKWVPRLWPQPFPFNVHPRTRAEAKNVKGTTGIFLLSPSFPYIISHRANLMSSNHQFFLPWVSELDDKPFEADKSWYIQLIYLKWCMFQALQSSRMAQHLEHCGRK